MWQWLWATLLRRNSLFFLIGIAPLTAWTAPTSLGPVSETEAQILWKDAKTAFDKKDFAEAKAGLERLVDRYPGIPSYRDAQEMLGITYVRLGFSERALPLLRAYVESEKDPSHAARGRLELGEAYLELRRFNEAFLLSQEFENSGTGPYDLAQALHSTPLLKAEGLLLKTRAQIGLNQDDRALRSLDSAQAILKGKEPPSLQDRIFDAQITLKTRTCSRLPSNGPLDEGQVRDQLQRRATCLNEALVLYQSHLITTRKPDSTVAKIGAAFDDFAHACKSPPSPPPLTPKDRSAVELKNYRMELIEALRNDCIQAFKEASHFLPPSSDLALQLEKIRHREFPVPSETQMPKQNHP